MKKNTIAIIGGGASGFITAISLAKVLKQRNINNTEIILLERMDRTGKKILATGNGKCNISNINSDINHYHGRDINFAKEILNKFTPKDTLKFFNDIGLLCKVYDDGKVYPYSNQSSSVLDILRIEAENLGIKEICSFEVENIKKQSNKFIITDKSGKVQHVSKVVIASGGKSSPNLGSNGSGYKLLVSLGHTITDTFPALVQIKSNNSFIKSLSGIKIDAIASILKNNKVIKKEKGELLFTDYGLSGILILQLSRIIGENFIKYNDYQSISICIDIMPDFTEKQLIDILHKRVLEQGWKQLDNFFTGMLNKRVGNMILKTAGISSLSTPSYKLCDNEINKLAKLIKSYIFQINGTMSWNNSQVTAGGVKTNEFKNDTLESKLVKGLYAVGEVLDIDGDCGGYNLQWAWSTGFIAGKSIGLIM